MLKEQKDRIKKKIRKFLLKKGLVPWIPNKSCIEIEITTACSLACFNCDRSVRQAPSNEHMSLEQIERFVKESIELDWKWERITLIGGEPTLHPQLFELLKIIKKYKDINNNCMIEIATNGYGRKVNEIINKLPNWIVIRNSKKESNTQSFSSYNIAPLDLKEYKNANFKRGCWVTERCGLGLSKYGYYPCGAGASIDRIFGFDVGQKKLSLVNDAILKNQLEILCKYCGHYKHNYDAERTTEEKMSISWQKAYENYRKTKPNLLLY